MRKPWEVIFNDEYIIVLNKIAKILIHPSPRREKYTLTSLLEKEMNQRVYPCHRLDRETTGLIIYAKDKETQRQIADEFRRQKIKKKYLALIKGRMKAKKGVLRGKIIDREGRRFKEPPKQALTSYRTLEDFDGLSLVELKPLTGRTNQLRIQLASAGHPILGERKYALGRQFAVKFRRLALHAFFISFIHPVSRERVSLKIDLPYDMKYFLKQRRAK